MKKRLVDGEIENAKKSTKIMITVVSILLIVLLGVTVYVAYLYSSGKILKRDDGELVIKNEPVRTKNKDIDINNTNIISLWNNVKITNPYWNDTLYNNQLSVKIEKLSMKEKLMIAKNKYKEYVKYDELTNKTYISEDKVKESVNLIFGNNTYERQEIIPYIPMNDLMFDSRFNHYFIDGKKEEADESIKKYEKIISSEIKNKTLYITSVVLFYEKVNSVLCKDETCDHLIEQLSKEKDYGEEYFYLYLEHNKANLFQYKYQFELDNTNFYKYIGYERLNS